MAKPIGKTAVLAAIRNKSRPFECKALDGATLMLRDLNFSQRAEVGGIYVNESMNDAQKQSAVQRIVVLTCIVNDDNTPMFDESDWPELEQSNGQMIDEVTKEVLGRIGGAEVKEAGNGSSPVQSESTASA